MSIEEIKSLAEKSFPKPTIRQTTLKTYIRNPFVSKYVKERANGICDLCESSAPFLDKNKKPYLESHHVKPLSEGGDDTIYNCCALCPSCHRRVHILNLPEDNSKLNEKLKKYNKNL